MRIVVNFPVFPIFFSQFRPIIKKKTTKMTKKNK